MTGARFIVLADLRSGSTLLASTLDAHRQIRCFGELFHERDFADNRPGGLDRGALDGACLIERVFDDREPRATGFRAMLDHPSPSRPQWSNFWEALHGREGLRVIHLQRRDRLAQYTSLQIALATGVFHPSPETPALAREERPTVHVDGEAFLAWRDGQRRRERERLRILADKPILRVSYERLISRWPKTIARIQRFLQVDIEALAPAKRRQETRPLEQVITNYDELVRRGLVETTVTAPG